MDGLCNCGIVWFRDGSSVGGDYIIMMKYRIARALGWTISEVNQFSITSLRDLVRSIDSNLALDIDRSIRSGAYLREWR